MIRPMGGMTSSLLLIVSRFSRFSNLGRLRYAIARLLQPDLTNDSNPIPLHSYAISHGYVLG